MLSSVWIAQPAFSTLLFAKRSIPRIPIAFSTLGCPAWDWNKILDFARQHEFAAIELRGLQGNLDLPSVPVFSPDRIAQTKREIETHKLRIACVSSSANLYFEDPARRAKELSDARRFIDLAGNLGLLTFAYLAARMPQTKIPYRTNRQKRESPLDCGNWAIMPHHVV